MNIYRISTAGREPPVRLIASTLRDQDPAYSPNGQIAFVSDRSGSREIWLSRADGTGQKRVTNFNGPDVGHLQWSPDGRRLGFYSRAQGHSDIFALDCDPASMRCGNPKRVISGIKAEVPSWSADGDFLYFASDRTGRWEVWKQAISNGQATQVTQNGGYASRESRDGKWLYFSKDRSDNIWRIPLQSAGRLSSREELVVGPPNNVQQRGWTVTPDEIVFTERAGNEQPGADDRHGHVRMLRRMEPRERQLPRPAHERVTRPGEPCQPVGEVEDVLVGNLELAEPGALDEHVAPPSSLLLHEIEQGEPGGKARSAKDAA